MPNQFFVTDQGNPDALSIAQVVENIVTQRQQRRLPVIQENKELFEKIRKAIKDLAGVKLLKVKEVAPMLHKILMETDFNKLDDQLKKLIERATMLEGRFGRDNVSIALVGHARMGKSTILQSITQLGDDVIPTSSYSDCTGAVSIIQNSSEPFIMEIEYYSADEFLEAVRTRLEGFGVNERLSSIDDIPNLFLDTEEGCKDREARIAFVEDYIKGYSRYKDCLKEKPQKIFTNREDVIEYVAKYKIFGSNEVVPTQYFEKKYPVEEIKDKNGNVVSKLVKFNKFVTVKKVYIKNRYEYGDVGKIIAIDTIGLGNAYTIEEDTKKMQDVLANEADIAVYNFKVNSSGCSTFPNEIKDELNEIYDVLSEYHPEKWIVFNLNRTAESNLPVTYDKLCQDVLQNASSYNYGEGRKPLVLGTCCNAKDKDEVRNNLVIPVLNIIKNNINDIDSSFLVDFNKKAIEFFEVYNAICKKIEGAMVEEVHGNENYLSIFKKNYSALRLRVKLEEYVKRLERDISKPCASIINDLAPQVDCLSKFVMKKSEIVAELNKMDAANAHAINVFHSLMDTILANILNFMKAVSVDSVTKIQEKAKNKIVSILYEDGLLKDVSVKTASKKKPTQEWLRAFCNEHLYSYKRLYSAFDSLLNFRMNIEGYMYSKYILACKPLHSVDRYTLPDESVTAEEKAQYIWQALMNSVREVKRNIIESFLLEDSIFNSSRNNTENSMPNLLIWCMAESFFREIIFTDGGAELEKLYYEKAPVLWGDKITELLSANSVMKDVQQKITALNSYNDRDIFKIMLSEGIAVEK